MIDIIKIYRSVLAHIAYTMDIQKRERFLEGKYRGEIIRNVHSLEKGLSIEKPRKFFGIPKIEEMLELTERYLLIGEHSEDVIYMVEDVIEEYLEFHRQEADFVKLENIIQKYEMLLKKMPKNGKCKFGGTIEISNDSNIQYDDLKRIIESRHSIRDFSNEPIPIELLRKAINLAYKCPSACNRQGVCVHVVSREKKCSLNEWVAGVGGFTDKVDKYILITGKVSEYRIDEPFQYVVSASIFAGYLSLTLQSVGIGACLVQRPVLTCKKWKKLQNELKIPKDEQIVIMVAVGMLKEHYKVPVSHRLKYEELVKEY